MNLTIKNRDLPLLLKLMQANKIVDVKEGNVTSFTNSILPSILLPKMDDTFEYGIRFLGNMIDRALKKRLDQDNPSYSLYDKTYNKNTKESRLLKSFMDPMNLFDQGDAPSYETMSYGIKWVCSIYKIDDDAKFYKDPYFLYAQYQNDDEQKVDEYIDNILFPYFHQALEVRDIIKEIENAIESNQNYELKNFYPEKFELLFMSYLHKLDPSVFVYFHQEYFPSFNYLSKSNLQYEFKEETQRVAFFDYTIKTFGLKKVFKEYGIENEIQLPENKSYTRVDVNNYNNLNALLLLEDKYNLENMMLDHNSIVDKKLKI